MLSQTFGKASVVENDSGRGALFLKFKFRNGMDTRFPTADAPRLDNSRIGHEFKLPASDVSAKGREVAANHTADYGRFVTQLHRFHSATELHDLTELFAV